jgi:nicotinamide riboside kinase
MAPIHIIISGASSVGKSTLVDECIRKFRLERKLKQYRFKPMHEVARAVLKRLNITGAHLQRHIQQQDIRQFANVQEKIIHEQLLNFDNEKQNNYLSDRSGFDALAYVHCYFDNEQAADSLFQTEEFQLLIQQCVGGLIFVIQPQEQLRAVNDNMRIVPNYEEQVRYTECLEFWYQRAGLPYFVIVDLDMAKRTEFIEQHINGHFHWLPPQMSIPLRLPFHLSKQNRHRPKNDIAAQPNFDHSYIRRIHVLDPQNVQISHERYDTNRLVEKYDPSCLNNKFVSVLLGRQLTNVFVQNILGNGISINGEEFNFIGYSNSQLKDRSCYLYGGSTDEIQQILDDNGDFHKIKTISKRSARIGLLFSSCTPTIHIESENIIEIDDIERNNYTFTDG